MEVHHLFPWKLFRLSHKVKYIRKENDDGSLDEWKRVMLEC